MTCHHTRATTNELHFNSSSTTYSLRTRCFHNSKLSPLITETYIWITQGLPQSHISLSLQHRVLSHQRQPIHSRLQLKHPLINRSINYQAAPSCPSVSSIQRCPCWSPVGSEQKVFGKNTQLLEGAWITVSPPAAPCAVSSYSSFLARLLLC